MNNTIRLGDDLFSAEYWSATLSLYEALESLAEGRVDRYVAYWQSRVGGSREAALAYVRGRKALIDSVRRGYDPEAWKSDPNRKPDWPARGFGPITVSIGPTGKIYPRDGSHRANILRLLGRPVEAQVFTRHVWWEGCRTVGGRPYTPYPHPDFDGLKPVRQGLQRMRAIAAALDAAKLGRRPKIFIVGAAIGYEAEYFLRANCQVDGCEPDPYRHTLLTSLVDRLPCDSADSRNFIRDKLDAFVFGEYDAVVAMSVLHHAARSLEHWRVLAERMAACPRIFVELPNDDRWQPKFADDAQTQGANPHALLLSTLISAGGYNAAASIHVDSGYDNRVLRYLARE